MKKLIIDRDDFKKISRNEIDELYVKYDLKQYIEYHSEYGHLHKKYPFLDDFFIKNRSTYSSSKMNTFVGYDLIPYGVQLTSFTMSVFLNAYFNKIK